MKEGFFETGLVLVFGFCHILLCPLFLVSYKVFDSSSIHVVQSTTTTRNGCDDVVRPHAIYSHFNIYLLEVLIS